VGGNETVGKGREPPSRGRTWTRWNSGHGHAADKGKNELDHSALRRLTGLLLLGPGLAEPDLFGNYATKMNGALVYQ
jgi:hypothetical protein